MASNFESSLSEQLDALQLWVCNAHKREVQKYLFDQHQLPHRVQTYQGRGDSSVLDPETSIILGEIEKNHLSPVLQKTFDMPRVVSLGEQPVFEVLASLVSPGGLEGGKADFLEEEQEEDEDDRGTYSQHMLDKWTQILTNLKIQQLTGFNSSSRDTPSPLVGRVTPTYRQVGVNYDETIFSPFTSSPSSLWRLSVESVGQLFVLYDILTLPFILAFQEDPPGIMRTFRVLMIVFWIFDLISRFFVGYYIEGGLLELRVRKTACHYLKTTFAFDFVILSFDIYDALFVGDGIAQMARFVKLAKLGKILGGLRAMRIFRLPKCSDALSEVVRSAARTELQLICFRLLRLVLMVLVVNHLIACLWWSIGNSEWDEIAWTKTSEISSRRLSYKYLTCLHWAVTQFTPASMEVAPTNSYERTFAIAVVMFGMLAFSSCIGSITQYLSRLKNYGSEDKLRECELREFLKEHDISFGLTQQMWNFLRVHKQERLLRRHEDSIALLQLIPESLTLELHAEMYLPTLVNHPFFQALSCREAVTMQNICSIAVSHEIVHSGHEFFGKGTPGKGMMFSRSGSLLYTLIRLQADVETTGPCPKTFQWSTHRRRTHQALPGACVVEEGAWISEAALWITKWVHCGWLVGLSVCELFLISSDKFHDYFATHTLTSCLAVSRYTAYFHSLMCEVGVWRYDGITDVSPDLLKVREMTDKSFAPDDILRDQTTAKLLGIRGLNLWHLISSDHSCKKLLDSDGTIRQSLSE